MKKIKFRGKNLTGEYIYGYFAEKFNDDGELVPVIIWDTENPAYFSEVYPESVAQFVGYDADDNEIYEGDKLCLKDDGNFSDVEMYFKFGGCFCPVGKKFSAFKLKGRGENENLS